MRLKNIHYRLQAFILTFFAKSKNPGGLTQH